MCVFLTLNNIDRFPGLVVRVKGAGDEIEIDHEEQRPRADVGPMVLPEDWVHKPDEGDSSKEATCEVKNNAHTIEMPFAVRVPPNINKDEARIALHEAARQYFSSARTGV